MYETLEKTCSHLNCTRGMPFWGVGIICLLRACDKSHYSRIQVAEQEKRWQGGHSEYKMTDKHNENFHVFPEYDYEIGAYIHSIYQIVPILTFFHLQNTTTHAWRDCSGSSDVLMWHAPFLLHGMELSHQQCVGKMIRSTRVQVLRVLHIILKRSHLEFERSLSWPFDTIIPFIF